MAAVLDRHNEPVSDASPPAATLYGAHHKRCVCESVEQAEEDNEK